MTRVQKITLGALSAFACGIWLVVLYTTSQGYQAWRQQPLGPTLAYPTQLQLPATWTASPAASQPMAIATLAPTLTFETETPASLFLACPGTQIPRSNILFASFPRELFKSAEVYDPVLKQDVFIWEADSDRLRSYVSDFQAGTWPFSSSSGAPQPESSSCE